MSCFVTPERLKGNLHEAIAASDLDPESDQETHGVPKGPGKISKGAYFLGPLGEPKGSPMSPLPPISPATVFRARVFCSMVSIYR